MGPLIDDLRAFLGARLLTSEAARAQHAENEAWYPPALPDAVARPATTEEVAQILRACRAHKVPVVAQGARTSLEGHHLATRGGIAIDMTGMDRVLAIHAEDLDVVVQPGVTREALNRDLRATGLFFPIDPGANATLGGMAATRASGTAAVRYGTMREAVLALEVVQADGQIIRTGTRARKSSTGYDLTHLFVGSEGTLGIITELTLRLHGQPEAQSAAICRFDTVENAVDTVTTTIQMGLPMARIELVDDAMVRGFNLSSDAGLVESPHLFIEFHGTEAGVAETAATFGEIAAEHGGHDFTWSTLPEERARLWSMRHGAHYAMRALRPGARSISTDVCVPISALAEAVSTARHEGDKLGLVQVIVGHVGDGNFHCGILVDPEDRAEIDRAHAFAKTLSDLALRLGGTISGEHGIGLGKRSKMRAEHGPAIETMRAIKRALDPEDILNPGKLLPDD
ncbi:FAD-binding oxidoreductase [Phaeovulum vinaykumarii]|uniref:D-lactate dehydrogenase (cytochrome) n=1 Tax=Phaeovulum vinaykumarii TaxID=407234 RepID=A0A1N7M8M3_9RHOB|nr:FAD-linked oxidase C-terminal domain-containing protein [Phaeovulum vinaykumarii]SIS82383.1 D-lactate dehydrogenase (cytochrome) [Phaeovulum vinaykumarii]SOC11021.1 D-lactate dehydrogenase (cytochrome) [Phaeovulum vinaykumarii]